MTDTNDNVLDYQQWYERYGKKLEEPTRRKPGRPRTHIDVRIAEKAEWVGDCWEWYGARGNNNQPLISLRDDTGTHMIQVRRYLYEEKTGERLSSSTQLALTCKNSRCINVDHFTLRNKYAKSRESKLNSLRKEGFSLFIKQQELTKAIRENEIAIQQLEEEIAAENAFSR